MKRRGRATEELPDEIKTGCFTVNCVPVKKAVDQLLQNFFSTLLNCLRRSIQADLVAIDAFLSGKKYPINDIKDSWDLILYILVKRFVIFCV